MPADSSSIIQRTVMKGQFVFREEETGHCAYVIKSGEVEILKFVEGEQVVLGKVVAGGMFGEMSLISNKPRMASARVLKEVDLMVIPIDVFENKLEKLDSFNRALIEVLSSHIRSLAGKLGTDTRVS
jgi:CRP-like cAMP-binding protein